MYRNLRFQTVEEVITELDRLQNSGIQTTTGLWSYFQIIKHLSDMLEFSMIGYPYLAPKIIRVLFGPIIKYFIFRRGAMSPGLPNPIAPSKREEGDVSFEIKLYRERLNKFLTFEGTFGEHPAFGKMIKSDWIKLHSVHAAHHLSYVEK
jgi:hypothetical protein